MPIIIAVFVAGLLGWMVAVPIDHSSGGENRLLRPDIGASTNLQVVATGPFMFAPPTLEMVPVQTDINVTFTNTEPNTYETFSILDHEGFVMSPVQMTQQFSTYGNLTNLVVGSNASTTGSFVSPGVGWYEFVSEAPGHFAVGMYGFIAFGEDLPSNLTIPVSVSSLVGSAASATSVALHWQDPPAGTFSNLSVLYGPMNSAPGSSVSVGTATSATITGLNADTTYSFSIEAWSGSVHGPATAATNVTTANSSSVGPGSQGTLPIYVWYAIGGAVALVVAAAVLFRVRSRRAQR